MSQAIKRHFAFRLFVSGFTDVFCHFSGRRIVVSFGIIPSLQAFVFAAMATPSQRLFWMDPLMDLSRARRYLAEKCETLWASQLRSPSPMDASELTPVETQALIFAAIAARDGVDPGDLELNKVLKLAAETKRTWCRLQAAMLGLCNLRYDHASSQLQAPKGDYADQIPLASGDSHQNR